MIKKGTKRKWVIELYQLMTRTNLYAGFKLLETKKDIYNNNDDDH